MRDVRILHIEDNEADVFFVKEGFKSTSFTPSFSHIDDGEKALAFLSKENVQETDYPDLILLDLNLPKVDGLTVLRHLKSHPFWRRIPVIVLTSSSAPSDIEKSYDLHANSYVLKPVGLDQMVETVSVIQKFWFGLNKFVTVCS